MVQYVIQNGRVIDPAQALDAQLDVLISDGEIGQIGQNLDVPESAQKIDAAGKWVVPGLVDMHVHLREPGREDEETIRSGTLAAAKGGFTAVACMANTLPVNDCQAVTRFIIEKSRDAFARVYPIAAITHGLQGSELSEMAELSGAGAAAFSDDGVTVRNPEVLRRALEYSKMLSQPIIEHCDDPDLAAGGVMNEGLVSTRLGLPGIPSIAEEVIVARDIQIAEYTEGRLHIAHVSTQKSVQLIREAKQRGVAVTAEVTPHHLFLTDDAVAGFDTNTKMNPPLRTESDRQALLSGLFDGTIDCIASDHAPHASFEKEVEFNYAPNGVIGLETALSLLLTRLVHTRKMTIGKLVEVMSIAPCAILKLPGGTLRSGSPADITIIDPERYWLVDASKFVSLSRNSPFKGWSMRGAAEMTFVAGRVRYAHTD
jgi:dihydroorotase